MARADDGDAALVEIKSVEASWPDVGTPAFSPAISPQDIFALKDGVYGAAVEDALRAVGYLVTAILAVFAVVVATVTKGRMPDLLFAIIPVIVIPFIIRWIQSR